MTHDMASTTVPAEQPAASSSGPGDTASRRIVVGVDGSPGSLAALRFAVVEADLRHADVRAVCAWRYPEANGGWSVVPPEAYNPHAAARQVLTDAIAAISGPADRTVVVAPMTTEGHAAAVLVEAAAETDLLVVGSRGHGGFIGLLLGSVSQHCVHHARCPVVVVPTPPTEQRRDPSAAGPAAVATPGSR